jgi:hypothetical protein
MAPPAVMSTMEDTTAMYMKKQKITDQSLNCKQFSHLSSGSDDPLNWGRTAAKLQGSHLDEIKHMVAAYFDTTEVAIEGVTLTVGQVTAVARRPQVQVSQYPLYCQIPPCQSFVSLIATIIQFSSMEGTILEYIHTDN